MVVAKATVRSDGGVIGGELAAAEAVIMGASAIVIAARKRDAIMRRKMEKVMVRP